MAAPAAVRPLERVIASTPGRPPVGGAANPMRVLTEALARDAAGVWDDAEAHRVVGVFDRLAGEWEQRFANEPLRMAPIDDALARGGSITWGTCLDIGVGPGVTTRHLAPRFERVLGLDLSFEMLRQARPGVPLVQADASQLPVADGSVDVAVLVNAFLFPAALDRALAPGGVVVWISSIGDDTPIYLPAEEVAAALPGAWTGVWAEAGDGTWAVLRRSSPDQT